MLVDLREIDVSLRMRWGRGTPCEGFCARTEAQCVLCSFGPGADEHRRAVDPVACEIDERCVRRSKGVVLRRHR